MLRKVLFILCYLTALSGVVEASTAVKCIRNEDLGLGGTYYIPANPANNHVRNHELIRKEPKSAQIAPWMDTGLYTTGTSKGHKSGGALSVLKGLVVGEWQPWQFTDYGDCALVACDPNDPSQGLCMPGKGEVVRDEPGYSPCTLKEGYGLYGLVALRQPDGKYPDPNTLSNAVTLPTNLFRTFHIGKLKKGRGGDQLFEIETTQTCEVDGGTTKCQKDLIDDPLSPYNGGTYIPRGKLYFKILDRYYGDNSGGYEVTITGGVHGGKGFIEKTLTSFQDTMYRVTQKLFNYILVDTRFIDMVRATLILYISITAIMFLIGKVEIDRKILVVNFLKIGLVVAVISPGSWNFFNDNLLMLFNEGTDQVANAIIDVTLTKDIGISSPIYANLPEDATAFSAYDLMLKVVTSAQTWAKAVSFIFFRWEFFRTVIICLCLIFTILGVVHSVKIYLFAKMQMYTLVALTVLFIVSFLFPVTRPLFDAWLRGMISSSLATILSTWTISIMLLLIVGNLQTLMNFRVCWQDVWTVSAKGVDIIDVDFWYPASKIEALEAASLPNLLALLVSSIMFYGFVKRIPELADGLSSIGGKPINKATFAGVSNQYKQAIHDLNLMKKLYQINSWSRSFLVKGALPKNSKLRKIVEKEYVTRTLNTIEGQIGVMEKFNKEISGKNMKLDKYSEIIRSKDNMSWAGKKSFKELHKKRHQQARDIVERVKEKFRNN